MIQKLINVLSLTGSVVRMLTLMRTSKRTYIDRTLRKVKSKEKKKEKQKNKNPKEKGIESGNVTYKKKLGFSVFFFFFFFFHLLWFPFCIALSST